MPLVSAIAVSVTAAAAVWASGRYPIIALTVAAAATVLQPVLDITFDAMDLVVVLIAFQASMNTQVPGWALGAFTFATLTVNDVWQRASLSGASMGSSVLYPALLTALAVGLGLQSRRIRRQNAELRALADVDRRAAVSDERRRIARDLHDVAAHHLSALVVRNKLARRLDTSDALRAAVDFSAHTASQTLTSLRNVVHVLKTDGDSLSYPVPRLHHLGGIFDHVRSAGLVVNMTTQDLGDIDEELEVALVRVIQESLSNILQHRGPGNCWVDLNREGAWVHLTIDDDGPLTEQVDPASSALGREGFGLVGMRERVSARDGQLTVAGSPRGGWRVSAVFELRTT
jgi:signal transduction histidine kinase